MKRTLWLVAGLAVVLICAMAQAPQVANTVAVKDTRTAINTALTSLYNAVAKGGYVTFTGPTVARSFALPDADATIMTNPMTTAGDVIVGGASGTPTRLAAGAADTVLMGQGAGVAPAYSGALPSCSNASTSKLLYNTSTHAFSCGTDGGGGSTITLNGSQVNQIVLSAAPTTDNTLTTNGSFSTTLTIPANAIAAGTPIEIWASGTLVQGANANQPLPTVKFGSLAVCGAATEGGFDTNATNPWTIHCVVTGISAGASGSVNGTGIWTTVPTGKRIQSYALNDATPTIDTTATQAVSIAVTASSWTATTMTLKQLRVRVN